SHPRTLTMAKKMPRGLVALSSSAIAAIYLAGFVYTRGADAGLASVATGMATATPAAATSTSASTPTTAAPRSTATATSTAVATATSTPISTATSTTAAYRDGT